MLDVTCWCERFIVPVRRADLHRGLTYSCGRCSNPDGPTIYAASRVPTGSGLPRLFNRKPA